MFSSFAAGIRSLWQGVRAGRALRAEMDAEFRSHMEFRAQDLMRAGVHADEARRQARLEFGSSEHYKDLGRTARGLKAFDTLFLSWLDFKLGFRMLVKYPGLSVVGGLALAFAIAIGAITFEIATRALHPTLPLPDGDRIVGLYNWDAAASRVDDRALHDFHRWRGELRTVRDLSAFRTVRRNLFAGKEHGEPVAITEISASAFGLALVPPLLGRTLTQSDEAPGAPDVMVIGHDAWQSRFAGDSSVVGRSVQVGAARTTIVGVMPQGFAFPIRESFWTALRLNPLDYPARAGPGIRMFGRLAPDVSIDDAQVELSAIGARATAGSRAAYEHVRPRVMSYARAMTDPAGEERLAIASMNLPVVMLLLLVCANVSLLLFARAATREAEIIVRTALGASRARIVTQLFAEALVLGAVATVVGLASAGVGLEKVMALLATSMSDGRLPFWITASLSPATLAYAAVLMLLSAAVAGLLPALKVTRGLGTQLRATAAGGGGLRFGGVWTAVIVAQVAVTVAFPAFAFFTRRAAEATRTIDPGFASQHVLSARLEMDRDASASVALRDTMEAAFPAHVAATYQELERRLLAEPTIAGVTVANWLPRLYPGDYFVAVDNGGAVSSDARWNGWYRLSGASVEPKFFSVLGVPILSGRTFHPGDLDTGSRATIVNESFVKKVLGDRHPIGRHIRYTRSLAWNDGVPTFAEPSPWYEIVGVVRDMGLAPADGLSSAGFFLPASPARLDPTYLAIKARGDPATLIPRVRAIASDIDPALRLHDAMPMDRLDDDDLNATRFAVRGFLAVSGLALVLSLAAIYAVMAFTVARRTREIGIRVALGAGPRLVIVEIFRRPVLQVALGVGTGALFLVALVVLGSQRLPTFAQCTAVVGYSVLMFAVCLFACVVPTRRALAVQPTDALKAE